MEQVFGIVWAILALALIAPWTWRLIRQDPQRTLQSVVGWLGLLVLLAWLYVYAGIGEWWEARRQLHPPLGRDAITIDRPSSPPI